MIKYPSIEQFRSVVRTVRTQHDYKGKDENDKPIYLHNSPYPTLRFVGTIKLHGTNAAVVLYKDGRIEYQSRERVLSIGQDNAGFMTYMSGLDLSSLFEGIEFEDHIVIYGEWCGGNIQKGVAISGLPKMFVIFGCKVDGEWVKYERDQVADSIRNIQDFPKYFIDIPFEDPELVQNTLIEWTLQVEEKCPVGEYFGVQGVGEGIVFTCVSNPHLKFKSKGEKHSSSKVKVLNAVDTEKLESIKQFVEYSCTENRLNQGLENIELDIKNTGDFVRWVVNDILKEETDTLVANNLEWKAVAGSVSKRASEFFRSKI